ncbi:MAG: hypothetical protein IIA51_08240 [Chloroflexi bacterium]|nr:hypothetical protein [Chloroflexota bacterium]
MAISTTLINRCVHAEGLGQPIDFTPNVKQLELTSVAATAVADGIVMLTPTLGLGQLHGEENKPALSQTEKGDKLFGYGPSLEDYEVYVIWMTDENGTHYYTVGATSKELLGTEDPASGSRAENGYKHFIEAREELKDNINGKQMEANRAQNSRMTSHGVSIGIAVVGGLICGFLSLGTCFVAFGLAAVGAWANGARSNGDKVSSQQELVTLQGQLDGIVSRIRGRFGQAMRDTATP